MAALSTSTAAAASLRLPSPLLPTRALASLSSTLRCFPLRRCAPCALVVSAFKKLSEALPVPIPHEPTQPLADEDSLPPKPEIYGVYDPAGELQFVGISRNVRASVEGHLRKVPADLCASVKVQDLTHLPFAARDVWKLMPSFPTRMEPQIFGVLSLQALTNKLKEVRMTCPLFDTSRWVRNLERAYYKMWNLYCSGQHPVSFKVKEDDNEFPCDR